MQYIIFNEEVYFNDLISLEEFYFRVNEFGCLVYFLGKVLFWDCSSV